MAGSVAEALFYEKILTFSLFLAFYGYQITGSIIDFISYLNKDIFVICVLIVDAAEYCNNEEFVGKCYDNEVIMITSSHYGRMRSGKCVRKNAGKLLFTHLN